VRTTTVRFDEETWADIQRESQRLGIAHAEFIRGAVHRRLGRLAEADRITELERRIDAVADRLTSLARLASSLSTAIGARRRA
jgi:hypothetical protein